MFKVSRSFRRFEMWSPAARLEHLHTVSLHLAGHRGDRGAPATCGSQGPQDCLPQARAAMAPSAGLSCPVM